MATISQRLLGGVSTGLIFALTASSAFAAPTPGGLSRADAQFFEKAASGGKAEIETGKLAASKSDCEDVKKFGEMMTSDHSDAGAKLESLAAKKGVSLPSEPRPDQKAAAAKLVKLSGKAFDQAYAKNMVKDHKQTVALFEKESSTTKDSELKSFTDETLPTLKKHLAEAERLEATVTKKK